MKVLALVLLVGLGPTILARLLARPDRFQLSLAEPLSDCSPVGLEIVATPAVPVISAAAAGLERRPFGARLGWGLGFAARQSCSGGRKCHRHCRHCCAVPC
jgi:hypothetical protein